MKTHALLFCFVVFAEFVVFVVFVVRAEDCRILADRTPDNANRRCSKSGMSAFDVVRIFTQSAQLDTKPTNFDANCQSKTLAMGVIEKPRPHPKWFPSRKTAGLWLFV